MSVSVELSEQEDVPTNAAIKSQLIAALEPYGVTILPDSQYPRLTLRGVTKAGKFAARTNTSFDALTFTALGLSLEFVQLVPLPNRNAYVAAVTWRSLSVSYTKHSESVEAAIREFVGEYLSVNNAPAPVERTTATPTVKKSNLGYFFDYGTVAENFLPSFPHDSEGIVTLQFNRSGPSALTVAKRTPLNGLVKNELLRLHGIRLYSPEYYAEEKDSVLMNDWIATRGASVFECHYRNDKYYFWYRKVPVGLESSRLRSTRSDHVLLRIGPAQDNCPLTSDLANAAFRR